MTLCIYPSVTTFTFFSFSILFFTYILLQRSRAKEKEKEVGQSRQCAEKTVDETVDGRDTELKEKTSRTISYKVEE